MHNWRLQGATEAQNLRAVKQILATSPDILAAERRNSGGMPKQHERGDGSLKQAWVWFQVFLKVPGKKQAILDCEGWLSDGRSFGFEVKAADWEYGKGNKQNKAKEAAQLERIQMIQGPPINGVAAFITNPDQVLEMIKERPSSMAERVAHNHVRAGSTPAVATKKLEHGLYDDVYRKGVAWLDANG